MRTSFFGKLLGDKRGNVLPLFAVAVIPMIGLIGGAVDISVAYMARSKLQKACDAGVLAGRQNMDGIAFTQEAKDEAQNFFDFNFPEGFYKTKKRKFDVSQDTASRAELIGSASADVPTSLMRVFGFTEISVSVNCNARKDIGHNDIVMVLDVTGSMNDSPSTGGGSKISKLRTGASGLYRALANTEGSTTRYGIVPYSHTVNVAGSLSKDDILDNQTYLAQRYYYYNGRYYSYVGTREVSAKESTWGRNDKSTDWAKDKFRDSSNGCIEERASDGYSSSPIQYSNKITQADIDARASGASDSTLQFGRYDPDVQYGENQSGCPSPAVKLREYATEKAFNDAVGTATARVTGGTYHDIGMLWGMRFISRTGLYSADNPTKIGEFPVNQHIVFMTDGALGTGPDLYSAFGVDRYTNRMQGSGTREEKHISRFESVCNLAKSKRVTVWVIALDVTDTEDIQNCATSPTHFHTSDGSDLEAVFEEIGRGIGRLRLTE